MSTLDLRRDVLSVNDERARALRQRFVRSGTHVLNLVSSPGTGKTTLLAGLLADLLDAGVSVAALVGDCATDNDAVRLMASGAPVRQIVTEGMCHLEADMISDHLLAWAGEGLSLDQLDVLIVENVGNLVCPSGFDLGESQRWVLLSVTEGEDKPLKYPAMFASADLVVITKTDLSEPCRFDRAAALAAIARVNPTVPVLFTSSFDGDGGDQLLQQVRRGVGAHTDVQASDRASNRASNSEGS